MPRILLVHTDNPLTRELLEHLRRAVRPAEAVCVATAEPAPLAPPKLSADEMATLLAGCLRPLPTPKRGKCPRTPVQPAPQWRGQSRGY